MCSAGLPDEAANWIETGNPVLSVADAQERGLKIRSLAENQIELVTELRKLADRYSNHT